MAAFRTKTGSGLYKPILIYEPAQVRKCLGAGKSVQRPLLEVSGGGCGVRMVCSGPTGRELPSGENQRTAGFAQNRAQVQERAT